MVKLFVSPINLPLSLGMAYPSMHDHTIHLTTVSPSDRPWDKHRHDTDLIADLYEQSDFTAYADRLHTCSNRLEFAVNDDGKLKLKASKFCRVRSCPVCQWRKQLKWRARMFQAFPAIIKDFPKGRFLLLTLTVKNCELGNLRHTVKAMAKGFGRFSRIKQFPGLGYIRSLEVTKSNNLAHPHYHVLMMVDGSYFKGERYLSQKRYGEMWQNAMRLDYTPIVDVRTVKPIKGEKGMMGAICETLKYSVKPSDLSSDKEWLIGLTNALHKTRAISLGGMFRDYLKETEPEDLVNINEDDDELDLDVNAFSLWAEWEQQRAKYRIVDND